MDVMRMATSICKNNIILTLDQAESHSMTLTRTAGWISSMPMVMHLIIFRPRGNPGMDCNGLKIREILSLSTIDFAILWAHIVCVPETPTGMGIWIYLP